MKNILAACSFAVLAQLVSSPAVAGPFGDEMSKCMVRATTAEDRTLLVRWVFSVIALHPDVRKLSAVDAATRTDLNKKMAALTTALLTERCAKETREALKNEGSGVLEGSFGVLGQVAMEGLFVDKDVNAGITEFSGFLDEKKLQELVESAK